MDISKSYIGISGFFDLWVRLMELRTRKMEARDSKIGESKILIISPPTDPGIKLLSQQNLNGGTYFLCFSPKMREIAEKYAKMKDITNLRLRTENFFYIPFGEGYFDVIFLNCFFDYCVKEAFDRVIGEIRRVLKDGGGLFSVYMELSSDFGARIWTALFRFFPFLSRGCYPVDIRPVLSQHGFDLKQDISMKRLGFPLRYLQAEKREGTIND